MAGEYGSITQPFTDFDSSSLDSSSSVNGSERTITPESFYSMASWNAHCFQPDISSSTAAATHLANSNYVTARRHAEVHKYPNATAPFHHRTYNPASPLQQGIGHACTASQVTEVHFPRRPRTALCNDGGTAWHQGCDTKPSARLINPYSIEGIKATPESRKEFWDWYQRWSQIKN
ncbi:uncharacterized protein PpBr36_11073 [Pyricularia pennisetigena]|uniref:uncharacterized protein n=1 Tax=Pyricularia pennisetigena TaxID=1578925 RepID=UPI00114EF3B5|nr:uncharacterized protein PpBr36_11073 [Pyricularia pennisetigena]TLS20619.1 hypothetical protein PpBr36_11073 [Pyricularia pennisetigena]